MNDIKVIFFFFYDSCCFRSPVMIYSSPTSPPSPLYLLRPTQTNLSEEQMSPSLLCFINFSLELSHFVALECLLTNSGVRSLLFWLFDSLHFQLCLVKLCSDSHPLGLNEQVLICFLAHFYMTFFFLKWHELPFATHFTSAMWLFIVKQQVQQEI